jgi:hypothetical protein
LPDRYIVSSQEAVTMASAKRAENTLEDIVTRHAWMPLKVLQTSALCPSLMHVNKQTV